MPALTNRELVSRACDNLHDGLLPIVEKAMREQYKMSTGDWVTAAHKGIARTGSVPPKGADLQFLLKCMKVHWQPRFNRLGDPTRAQVSLLLDARNGLLAHYAGGSADVSAHDAREVVKPVVRLLKALDVPQAAGADEIFQELRAREAHDLLGSTAPTPVSTPAADPSLDDEPAVHPGATYVAVPSTTVEDPRMRPSDTQVPPARQASRPLPYTGKEPSNVSKDAKYGCRLDGQIKLEYDLGNGEETLLTTDDHPDLVAMVRMVKETFDEPPGGVFYVNEHHHVLVKAAGQTWYAGEYHRMLTFEFEGRAIGPVPPADAKTGDPWHGPHVGINYTLSADGRDVYFKRTVRKGVLKKELLSNYADASVVASLARPVKQAGGRMYINEARALFTPALRDSVWTYVYLGTVAPENWFPAPQTNE